MSGNSPGALKKIRGIVLESRTIQEGDALIRLLPEIGQVENFRVRGIRKVKPGRSRQWNPVLFPTWTIIIPKTKRRITSKRFRLSIGLTGLSRDISRRCSCRILWNSFPLSLRTERSIRASFDFFSGHWRNWKKMVLPD